MNSHQIQEDELELKRKGCFSFRGRDRMSHRVDFYSRREEKEELAHDQKIEETLPERRPRPQP